MALLPLATIFAGVAAGGRAAVAEDAKADIAALAERCATRLSIAFLGRGASPEYMASADPKSEIDRLLASEDFYERFARFVNTEFNESPGATSMEDAPYHLARYVLANDKPWSDLFIGNYRLTILFNNVAVSEDPSQNGLGYFRSEGWYTRYEGNEEQGIKIATAYRILNNVVGLRLVAATNAPDADVSAAGRRAGACKGCHYDDWYALDKVAAILPLKGQAYDAYREGPKEILGDKRVSNDKELVTALVESENFSVNACRLAFKFLYGREDNACEGPTLDRCVDTFKEQKTIQSALASIVAEPGFCD